MPIVKSVFDRNIKLFVDLEFNNTLNESNPAEGANKIREFIEQKIKETESNSAGLDKKQEQSDDLESLNIGYNDPLTKLADSKFEARLDIESYKNENFTRSEIDKERLQTMSDDIYYLQTIILMYLLLNLKNYYIEHPALQQELNWLPEFIADYTKQIHNKRSVTNPISVMAPFHKYGVKTVLAGFISVGLFLQLFNSVRVHFSNNPWEKRAWQQSGVLNQFATAEVVVIAIYLLMVSTLKLVSDWRSRFKETIAVYNDLRFQLLKNMPVQEQSLANGAQSEVRPHIG